MFTIVAKYLKAFSVKETAVSDILTFPYSHSHTHIPISHSHIHIPTSHSHIYIPIPHPHLQLT